MKREYGIGRTIVVADKGMNTGMNIAFNLIKGDGYVYSQTMRGGHKELKDYVLDASNYRQESDKYKIKSRVYPREIVIQDKEGISKRLRIAEKQVVFYSEDYARKAKAEREPVLMKARDLVGSPGKYNKATSYGAAKYVKNLQFDKKTGEIFTAIDQRLIFDEEELREEEKYDGYYAIVTSEQEKADDEIIEIYRGLWKIEESFKVTKSDLETRPVYLSREERIQAHFLICFVGLTFARILERRFEGAYSFSRIAESLCSVSCSHLEENWYVFDYADEVTEAIQKKMGIELNRKYLSLGEIRKILGDTKKD
jgi:transposase